MLLYNSGYAVFSKSERQSARHDTNVTAHDALRTTQSPGLFDGEDEHHLNTPDSLVVKQDGLCPSRLGLNVNRPGICFYGAM